MERSLTFASWSGGSLTREREVAAREFVEGRAVGRVFCGRLAGIEIV